MILLHVITENETQVTDTPLEVEDSVGNEINSNEMKALVKVCSCLILYNDQSGNQYCFLFQGA